MKNESRQALRGLASKLEQLPLRMGGGDTEREALAARLTDAANGCGELLLTDLWLATRLLGPGGQDVVLGVFNAVATAEAAAIELSPYPASADDNAADNLVRKLVAMELPLGLARRRASVVEKLQAYLDNKSHDLAVQDMADAAGLLGEEGYSLVEGLLRALFVGPLDVACAALWSEVTAHYGVRASLDAYLSGVQVVFPKRSGTKSARMKNLLPHITAAADAAFCLRKGIEVNDIDDVIDRLASKLELVGETKLAAELENALEVWSRFKTVYGRRVFETTHRDSAR